MGLFSFLHLPRHREFNFQPRYYDPIKEEIENRVQRIKNEKNSEIDDRSLKISSAFRRHQVQNKAASINQVLLFLFFSLLVISYWYFGTNGILMLFLAVSLFWIGRKILRKRKK